MAISNKDLVERQKSAANGEFVSKFRPPPAGLAATEFRLCIQYQKIRTCRLGNQCVEAHGTEELEEWTACWNLRKDRISKKFEKNVASQTFLQRIQLDCNQADELNSIFVSSLPFVETQIEEEAHTTLGTKPAATKWTIWVKSSQVLQNVALLEDNNRENFTIQGVLTQLNAKHGHVTKSCQEWNNNSRENQGILAITIKFRANVYGSFSQAVILGKKKRYIFFSCHSMFFIYRFRVQTLHLHQASG